MQSRLKQGILAAMGVLFATMVSAQDRPKVVAVNYPLQYIAERLSGGAADVVFLVPRDDDPSFWRPSVADISTIQSSDLILLNGAAFATWVDRVSLPRSRLVNTSAAVKDQYIVTESITHSHGDGGEHSHEGLASYLWLDPMLAAAQAEAVAQALVGRDLIPQEEVENQLNALRADLEQLDRQAETVFANMQGTKLIATHPRYQYMGRRYGLSVISLEWEAGATPDAEQLTALRTLIDQTGAKILIWEAEPSAKALRAASELGLQNIIFPTLVHPPEDGDFVSAYKNALSAFAEANARLSP